MLDLLFKMKERGHAFLFKKLHVHYDAKVRTTWAEQYGSYNWLDIPRVRDRINYLITGDAGTGYPAYVLQRFFAAGRDLKMLSLGCGAGLREIEFAECGDFSTIDALDIARDRIASAKRNAQAKGIRCVNFVAADAYTHRLDPDHYDAVLCQSFLHHCRNIGTIVDWLRASLKRGGILIIHDYVGPERFQWTKEQIKLVNRILSRLPSRRKGRAVSNTQRSKVYPPGWLRMLLSDPSEAVESRRILPAIRRAFTAVEEKPLGGNVLHPLFKDIAQNFLSADDDTDELLDMIFEAEDNFLARGHESDFLFGVYAKT
jgi:SAM-dependent methyltransferase